MSISHPPPCPERSYGARKIGKFEVLLCTEMAKIIFNLGLNTAESTHHMKKSFK